MRVQRTACRTRGLLLLTTWALWAFNIAPAAGAEQTTATRLDPAARLPSGGSAIEYWDLTAQLDSGHRVVARFLISNAGPGDQHGAAVGYLIRPDGSSQRFKNGRMRRRWTLSSDRLALDIGSSHLDLHQPEGRLQISKRAVKIDLRFRHAGAGIVPPDVLPRGYHLDLLDSAAVAEGTIWLPEMAEPRAVRGHIGLVHTWSEKAEAKQVLRRIEFFSLQEGMPLYLLDLMTPKGKRTRWLTLTQSHKSILSLVNFPLRLAAPLSDEDPKYWTPGQIQLSDTNLSGEITLRDTLMRHNPLAPLPAVFRFLVSLNMQPRQLWAESEFDVTLPPGLGTPTLRLKGSGVTMVTFLNPVESP